MKKLSATIFCLLAIACLSFLLHRQSHTEIPKLGRSGTAGLRLGVAEAFIQANETPDFAGNTDSAAEFAEHFTTNLRSQDLAAPSSPIRTYCFMQKDSFVMLTRLSALRQFPESKKREVEEFAWSHINDYANSKHPGLKKRAVCFIGDGEFLLLLIGEDSKPMLKLAAITDVDRVMIIRQILPFFEEAM